MAERPLSTSARSDGGNPRSVAASTRIVLRPIGSPLPLGLLALGTGGLLLSCIQIGAFAAPESKTVALILLGFVVPLQLAVTILCFLGRDTVAGAGIGVFAGAWLATSLVLLSSSPGSTSPAFGVFLLSVAAALLVIISAAAGGKAGPAIVMLVGSARFLLAGLYELTATRGVEHAGAVVGFVLVGTAAYFALASEIEDIHGEPKLPTGRRSRARLAMTGSFPDQLQGLEREAGVRQQL